MIMQKANQHEMSCGQLLPWGRTFYSIWAESGLLGDGRGKCCSELLFHCYSCPGSYLAQTKIARELFLLSVSLQQLSKLPKLVSLSEYRVCALVLPLPCSFSEIGKAEKDVFLCQEIPAAALEQLSCCSWALWVSFVCFLLLYVWIFSPLPCVARRCSDIANHTNSLQKDPSRRTCKAVSGSSLGFFVYKAPLFPLY